jgi:hypothetical protein
VLWSIVGADWREWMGTQSLITNHESLITNH